MKTLLQFLFLTVVNLVALTCEAQTTNLVELTLPKNWRPKEPFSIIFTPLANTRVVKVFVLVKSENQKAEPGDRLRMVLKQPVPLLDSFERSEVPKLEDLKKSGLATPMRGWKLGEPKLTLEQPRLARLSYSF